MDIQAIYLKAQPVLMKLLVGIITVAIIKLAPKLGLQLSAEDIAVIACLGATTILGMGLNWAAKTHATITSTPVDPLKQPSAPDGDGKQSS